jgi:alkanesulfonate monooxygenase SsuD/methylene tetrahydromethanopterin reductase-like flavin-dependent oxidoreductase (luciferase family)
LPIAARYADAWNVTTSAPEIFREKSERLTTLCATVGRDPQAIRRSVATGFLIGRDAREVEARKQRADRVVATKGWMYGTAAEIGGRLTKLNEAGVQRAILGHYLLDDDDALELIAAEVLPTV